MAGGIGTNGAGPVRFGRVMDISAPRSPGITTRLTISVADTETQTAEARICGTAKAIGKISPRAGPRPLAIADATVGMTRARAITLTRRTAKLTAPAARIDPRATIPTCRSARVTAHATTAGATFPRTADRRETNYRVAEGTRGINSLRMRIAKMRLGAGITLIHGPSMADQAASPIKCQTFGVDGDNRARRRKVSKLPSA